MIATDSQKAEKNVLQIVAESFIIWKNLKSIFFFFISDEKRDRRRMHKSFLSSLKNANLRKKVSPRQQQQQQSMQYRQYIVYSLCLVLWPGEVRSVKPIFDLANNMRLVRIFVEVFFMVLVMFCGQ